MAKLNIPECLIILCLITYPTLGLQQGIAPKWMVDLLCKGINGIAPVPWDCNGYLFCSSNPMVTLGSWFKCNEGLHFDATLSLTSCVRSKRSCIDGHTVSVDVCPMIPALKFPHPHSCAMYFDCSQTQVLPQYSMRIYENECPYPQVFDAETGDCQMMSRQCVKAPKSKADYRKELFSFSQECAGKTNGLHPKPGLPEFSPDYIECQGGVLVASNQCVFHRVFDPVVGNCVIDFTASLKVFCSFNPYSLLPDHRNCARFFNCSQTSSLFRHSPYLTECVYPNLYDTAVQDCVMFDQLSTPCGERFEPIVPCDYKVGQCIGRKYCIPCIAQCRGKQDGPYPFPRLVNTRYHLQCKSERTINILACPAGEIYDDDLRRCVLEGMKEPEVPPAPVGCQCMDNIEPLSADIEELKALVDKLQTVPTQVTSPPYDCIQPPTLPNSFVELRYHHDKAEARYTCLEGFAHCEGELTAVCSMDDDWDASSLSPCNQNVWTDTNTVDIPCVLRKKNVIMFSGHAVSPWFAVTLTDKDLGQIKFYMKVRPDEPQVMLGPNDQSVKSLSPSAPITGEMTWIIEVNKDSFKVLLNDQYLATVDSAVPTGTAMLTIGDGFKLGGIRFNPKGASELEPPPLRMNLALGKHTEASSSLDPSKPDLATDGLSMSDFSLNSCWAAAAEDKKRWWMVDLGKAFHVSHVIITTVDCGETCDKRLMNFKVEVTMEKPVAGQQSPDEECNSYPDPVLEASVIRVDCLNDNYGRYVMITSSEASMGFCELEVYGSVDVPTGWSPFSCQDPPLIKGGTVELAYTDSEAIATYTCQETAMMCDENYELRCKNETGWDGVPGECLETVFDIERPQVIKFCQVQLGSAFEFLIKTDNIVEIRLLDEEQSDSLRLSLSPDTGSVLLAGKLGYYHEFQTQPFEGRETVRLVVKLLTESVQIDVDGEMLFTSAENEYPPEMFKVSSIGSNVQKIVYFPPIAPGVVRERLNNNLALRSQMKSASSGSGGSPEMAVDGDATCWTSKAGDVIQWIQVDLKNYYYIREIKIVGGQILRGYIVNVYQQDPETEATAVAKLCYQTSGDMSPEDTLPCADDVWGRYVRLQSIDISDPDNLLKVCEFEVYGDKAVQAKPRPTSTECPPPPTHPDSVVSVARSPDKTTAEYRCLDGYTACVDTNTIVCDGTNGWVGSPAPCIKEGHITRFEGMGPSTIFCPLELGDSIEVFITPKESKLAVNLISGDTTFFRFNWDSVVSQVFGRQVLTTDADRIPIKNDKESRIVVTFLSHAFDVDVDGMTFYVRAAEMSAGEAFFGGNLRTFTVRRAKLNESALVSYPENLALSHTAVASSYLDGTQFNPGNEVDGDFSMDGTTGSCWIAAGEDQNPWWIVDLDQYYFMSDIGITTRSTAGCNENCVKRTRDFVVEMFYESPEIHPEQKGDLCLEYQGSLPHTTTTKLKCTTKVFGRYVRISAPNRKDGEDHVSFTLCEVEVFGGAVVRADRQQRNLALFRPVDASSFTESVGTAGNANSGIEDLSVTSQTCWIPTSDQSPFWRVTLDALYYIKHIKITSKTPCAEANCGDTLQDPSITVAPVDLDILYAECFEYKGIFPAGATKLLKCTQKLLGQYVKVNLGENPFPIHPMAICEVEVYGDKTAIVPSRESTNIALKRLVTSSSRDAPAEWAVDGNKATELADNTCWIAAPDEDKSWLQVQLDGHYMVSAVEITTLTNCDNCVVTSFNIMVYPESFTKAHECACCNGDLKLGQSTLIECDQSVVGRIVEFSAIAPQYKLAICEFVVFGDKVVNTEWSPSSCPEPPLLPNACVDICYHSDHAVATYTCNTNYTTCSGSDELHCRGRDGWEGTPTPCIQTTLEVNHGQGPEIKEFPICFPKLGEGIELWVTPKQAKCSLDILSQFGGKISLTMIPGVPTTEESPYSLTIGMLELDKQSHVQLILLTEGILLRVNGEKVKLIPRGDSLPRLYYVKSNDGLHIRMAKPVSRYADDIIRVPVKENLAPGKAYAASYTFFNPGLVFDGDTSQDAEVAKSCWAGEYGDEQHWIGVDLGGFYFITHLVLYNRDPGECPSCAEKTHDFTIHVKPTQRLDELATLCAFYEGLMPASAIETVECKAGAWGRYVQIRSTFVIDAEDTMGFCEVEVYGDAVVEKAWSAFDCPKPPAAPDATVQLSYSADKAIATYTCVDGYSMCEGSNVMECHDEVGWMGTLGQCIQTTLQLNYGESYSSSILKFCPLKLGAGIEFSITIMDTGKMSLGSFLHITFPLTTTDQNTVYNDDPLHPIFRPEKHIPFKTEVVVSVIYLSQRILVLLDNEFFAQIPVYIETPLVDEVYFEGDITLRSVRPIMRYKHGIERRRVSNNLALKKDTFSSSTDSGVTDSSSVVDGDITMGIPAKCWRAGPQDLNQWYEIQLWDYYFVRQLRIFTTESGCPECVDSNYDVAVDVLQYNNMEMLTTRCAFYSGVIPDGTETRIHCSKDVWGRIVRITATHREDVDHRLHLCEVEIYGDEVVDTEYSVCRRSPVANGKMTYSGILRGDDRTLQCDEGALMCPNDDTRVTVCADTAKWEPETLRTCDRFIWSLPDVPFKAPLPCSASDQIQIIVEGVPTGNTKIGISLIMGLDHFFSCTVVFNDLGEVNQVKFYGERSGVSGPTKRKTEFPFVVGQKFRFKFLLTKSTWVVDTEILTEGPIVNFQYTNLVGKADPTEIEITGAVDLTLVQVNDLL